MNPQQLNDLLRPLMLPDLRTECRSRGLNPAGGRDSLVERVRQHMLASGNFVLAGQEAPIKESPEVVAAPTTGNNYTRPEGQNVGNFLTDRASSRVIHPPGGKSNISFGGDEAIPSPVKTKVTTDSPPAEQSSTIQAEQLLGSPAGSPSKLGFAGPASPIAGSGEVDASPKIAAARMSNNNYHRSEGQNVGNFMTDRNSSRVIAPPGGHSNITFG